MSKLPLILAVVTATVMTSGCATLGLVQTRSSSSQSAVGSVQVLGPVLRPQTIQIPSTGTTLDRVVAAGRRAGDSGLSQSKTEYVYRQRGITRIFVPSLLLQATSLGDIRVEQGDVVCGIPFEQTPLGTRNDKLPKESSITLQGLLTVQPEGFRDTNHITIDTQTANSFECVLKADPNNLPMSQLTLGFIETILAVNTPGQAASLNCGITIGLRQGQADKVPANIVVVRSIASDGFIEEYVLPYGDEVSVQAPNFRRPPVFLKEADIVEYTRIELLPYAVEGHVVSALSETGTILADEMVEEAKKRCTVQASPRLQPLSAMFRNSAQQSSAVLKNTLKPAANLLRAQTGH